MPFMLEREHAVEGQETIESLKDLKGDLHAHSAFSQEAGETYLDTYPPEQLAAYITKHVGPGMEYFSLTDHSTDVNEVPVGPDKETDARMLKQKQAIGQINESRKFPGLTLLAGVETALTPEGKPDVGDEVLAQMDVVIASIHQPEDMSAKQRMEIYRKIVKNPYVDILGHPISNWDASVRLSEEQERELIDLAKQHDKAIEINVNRFDHYGQEFLERLVKSGVKISCGTDTHVPSKVGEDKPMGAGWRRYARVTRGLKKAGARKDQVLNTYSLERFRGWREERTERFRKKT